MDIDYLKQELIDSLKDIDKNRLSLCDLKNYAEVVKITSEIKGNEYSEVLTGMLSDIPMPYGYKALGGSMTIKEMRRSKNKEDKEDEEEDED